MRRKPKWWSLLKSSSLVQIHFQLLCQLPTQSKNDTGHQHCLESHSNLSSCRAIRDGISRGGGLHTAWPRGYNSANFYVQFRVWEAWIPGFVSQSHGLANHLTSTNLNNYTCKSSIITKNRHSNITWLLIWYRKEDTTSPLWPVCQKCKTWVW